MNENFKINEVLVNSSYNDVKEFALESFAREIDQNIQNELLTQILLDYSSISKDLKKLNKKLSINQEILLEAQNIAKLGRWDIDLETKNFEWSESLYDILELDYSLPTSHTLFLSRVHPDDQLIVKKQYNDFLDRNISGTTRYRLIMDDGRIKWVHLKLNPVFDTEGKIVRYYGTLQDITEMKQIEDKLNEYNHRLEQLVDEKVKEISTSQMSTIYALIKLSESRDDDTGAHIERTAAFCRLISEKARLLPEYKDEINDEFINTIYKASPLHDIGKVGIPDSILLKPGKLTSKEFELMKTHVQIGYDTLSKIGKQYNRNYFILMGMDIALYHHEKWNGEGYINGLSKKNIPLPARIMAIADVYDALRSKRIYKDAFSHEKSVEIIQSSKGSHFDPALVDIFIKNQNDFYNLFNSVNKSL